MDSLYPKIRLFVEPSLHVGARVVLPAGQAHYLMNVMRLEAGAHVAVFNGADGEWRAGAAGAGAQEYAAIKTRWRKLGRVITDWGDWTEHLLKRCAHPR